MSVSLAPALDQMSPMPDGYADLLARAAETARQDERVLALWVGGSVARGVADAGSDLDLMVAVRTESFEEFADDVVGWLARVADLILVQPLPGVRGGAFSTTRDCLRIDLIAEPVARLRRTPYPYRIAVLDPDDLTARIPPGGSEPGPDAVEMAALVTEFHRLSAIFPAAVVAREDWLLGVVGVSSVQQLLYQLFTAANAPLPVMGIKQWSSRLTPEQRHVLAHLPSAQADRDSVVGAMLAVRSAFLAAGRQAVERHGVVWPEEIEEAVTAYWVREGLLQPGRTEV